MKHALPLSLLCWLLSFSRALAVYALPAAEPETAASSPAKEAVAAFVEGRWTRAAALARPLADRNDPDGLFLMALTQESAEPARVSRGQAMDYYYRKAAEHGHPEALWRRSLIALASQVAKEREQELARLETAANGGDLQAQRVLGEAWLRGFVDGKRSFAEADQWWRKAAAGGDVPALLLLAKLYGGTFEFPEKVDLKRSVTFYRQLAELGQERAYVPLATLLLLAGEATHDELEGRKWLAAAREKNLPAAYRIAGDFEATVRKNEEAALASYRAGAERGEKSCIFQLALRSLARDPRSDEGTSWLKRAADAGLPEAALELSRRLPADGPARLHYLIAAANEGLPRAQYELGLCYLEGRNGTPDPVAALPWLTEAMKSGDAEMQYRLATLHEQGIGCPVNYANAGVLYGLACNKGHQLAPGRIAHLAAEGLGTRQDLTQAWAYATVAVERGDESSRDLLTALNGKLSSAAKEDAGKIVTNLRELAKKPAWSAEKPQAAAGAGR